MARVLVKCTGISVPPAAATAGDAPHWCRPAARRSSGSVLSCPCTDKPLVSPSGERSCCLLVCLCVCDGAPMLLPCLPGLWVGLCLQLWRVCVCVCGSPGASVSVDRSYSYTLHTRVRAPTYVYPPLHGAGSPRHVHSLWQMGFYPLCTYSAAPGACLAEALTCVGGAGALVAAGNRHSLDGCHAPVLSV